MTTRPSPHASASSPSRIRSRAPGELHGFPYSTVELDRNGASRNRDQLNSAMAQLSAVDPTDVLMLVHGWNATRASAEARYGRYLEHARTLVDGTLSQNLSGRRWAVIGLVWPSMPEVLQAPHTAGDDALKAAAQEVFPHDSALSGALQAGRVPERDHLERLIHQVMTRDVFVQDPDVPARERGRVALRDEGLDLGKLWRDLIVWASYYEMRARAGDIGERGGRGLVRDIQRAAPNARVHLLGHSFGARLAASVARGPDQDEALHLSSLHLIQGAFSHFGFGAATGSAPEGYFRPVLTNHVIQGPILVTHTKNDLALRLLYTVASAVASHTRDVRATVNPFGAIGVTGALNAGAQAITLNADAALTFRPGQLYNLQSDAVIPNHGDVEQFDVVRAVLRGISVT